MSSADGKAKSTGLSIQIAEQKLRRRGERDWERDRGLQDLAIPKANAELIAYCLDLNTGHIRNAYAEFRKQKAALPDWMLPWLDRLLAETESKPKLKSNSTTVRDLRVLVKVQNRLDGTIPNPLDPGVLTLLAKEHRCSEEAIKQSIARIRKKIRSGTLFPPIPG